MSSQYDLVVIGSGPAGQRAAVQAAKLKKKVLLIEKSDLGGHCLHTGTIPSKTLREAALTWKQEGSALDWIMKRKDQVVRDEVDVIQKQLFRNGIELLKADARFIDAHCIETTSKEGIKRQIQSAFFIIASGSRPRRPSDIAFDGTHILDSDDILKIKRFPKTLAVLGAGVIGCEYASIFQQLGVSVTLVDQRAGLMRHIDDEIISRMLSHFQGQGMKVLLGKKFGPMKKINDRVSVELGGENFEFDQVLYCMGRLSNTETLNFSALNIKLDERGTILVNQNGQSSLSHIYAAGDVIGFPALAASSAEQGRRAALHAFGIQSQQSNFHLPYGIYTIPEISTFGSDEKMLTEQKIPYVVGKALYKELARGQIMDDEHGFLKLLVDQKTHKILGIHIIGSQATELIHIGQVAVLLGADVEFFVENIFNYPTLAEAYKVAALNAANQLR